MTSMPPLPPDPSRFARPGTPPNSLGGTGLALILAAGGMLVGTLIITVAGVWSLPYVGRYDTILFTCDAIALGTPIGLGALIGRSANPLVPFGTAGFAVVGFVVHHVLVSTWALARPPGLVAESRMPLVKAFGKIIANYGDIVSHWSAPVWISMVAAAVITAGLSLLGGVLGRKKRHAVPGMFAGPGFAPHPSAVRMPQGGPAPYGPPTGQRESAPNPVQDPRAGRPPSSQL